MPHARLEQMFSSRPVYLRMFAQSEPGRPGRSASSGGGAVFGVQASGCRHYSFIYGPCLEGCSILPQYLALAHTIWSHQKNVTESQFFGSSCRYVNLWIENDRSTPVQPESSRAKTTLETTQGQIHVCFSQFLFKFLLPDAVSVGD